MTGDKQLCCNLRTLPTLRPFPGCVSMALNLRAGAQGPCATCLLHNMAHHGACNALRRYGYMEVVKQDEAWVELLLGRVLHLLYRTLQDRCSRVPTLHHDLGLPESYKVPVRGCSCPLDCH